jgi:hypothetical protein
MPPQGRGHPPKLSGHGLRNLGCGVPDADGTGPPGPDAMLDSFEKLIHRGYNRRVTMIRSIFYNFVAHLGFLVVAAPPRDVNGPVTFS